MRADDLATARPHLTEAAELLLHESDREALADDVRRASDLASELLVE
ncbi:hypothetical protein ACF1A9_15060 [Streptomyces sp. NPDC014872]